MLQYNKEYLLDEANLFSIVESVKPILAKRKELYERYTRSASTSDTKIPLEYYITNIATGFSGGKAPVYSIRQEENEDKKEIIKRLFNKEVGLNADDKEFKIIIDYIKDYNDDGSFYYELRKWYNICGAAYGIHYESEANEIVYAILSPIQTVAIYDYNTPVNKLALLRTWEEKDAQNTPYNMVEITIDNEKRYYKNYNKEPKYLEDKDMREDNTWLQLPFIAIENPDKLGLFEPVIDLIDTFEGIIRNNKNIFQYNDEAKLKITGFVPQSGETLIPEMKDGQPVIDPQTGLPKMIENENRKREEAEILKAKIFFTPDEEGDIEWIIKNINDVASENHKRTLIELILMVTCVPNFTDVGFTKADNSAALEKKFFPLEQIMIQSDAHFKKELLYMWENIIDRINKKYKTSFDFREIQISLPRNIPNDKSAMVDVALKLRGLLSDETVIGKLPFDLDSESELAKMDAQNQANIEKNLASMEAMGQTIKTDKNMTGKEKKQELPPGNQKQDAEQELKQLEKPIKK